MLRSDTQDLCWPRVTWHHETMVKHGEMFGLTRFPTFKWRPWPCARLGRIAATFTAQGVTLSLAPPRLQNFINFSSHLNHLNVQCLGVWKVSTLVLQDLACARVYAGMKVWILDGCFNAELYSPWMPAWIWFISYVCPATKIKNVMCKSNHRKITSHCHGTRKIILKKNN